jgi:hypothetical protein
MKILPKSGEKSTLGQRLPVGKTVLLLQNHLSGNTGCGREIFSASQMNPQQQIH